MVTTRSQLMIARLASATQRQTTRKTRSSNINTNALASHFVAKRTTISRWNGRMQTKKKTLFSFGTAFTPVFVRPVVIRPIQQKSESLPCGILRPIPEYGYVHLLDNVSEPMYVCMLASMIQKGDHMGIQCMIQLYDDIHPKYLVDAIEMAVNLGHLECIKLLLSVETQWSSHLNNSTALADACNTKHHEIARLLLLDGRFRAHVIAENGDIEALTFESLPS